MPFFEVDDNVTNFDRGIEGVCLQPKRIRATTRHAFHHQMALGRVHFDPLLYNLALLLGRRAEQFILFGIHY